MALNCIQCVYIASFPSTVAINSTVLVTINNLIYVYLITEGWKWPLGMVVSKCCMCLGTCPGCVPTSHQVTAGKYPSSPVIPIGN